MKNEIAEQVRDAALRLTHKGLFGQPADSFSMRVPGTDEILWLRDSQEQMQSAALSDQDDEPGLHAAIYRNRADAGAVLLNMTRWSEQLSVIGQTPPTLFDEQARHLGRIASPVRTGDRDGLVGAIQNGSNVVLFGRQCLRIGMTRDRVVFNAELFEKCAMAFVIAYANGQKIKTIPRWVQYIAGGRLRKDQKRAAESYANGQIPQGMNAY